MRRESEDKRLLVADDDGPLVESLVGVLEPYFPTIAVRSGEEALEVLSSSNVDLVLIDMYLGGTTGLDVIRFSKTQDRQRPCILMSGDLNDCLRKEAEVARADHVLSKPISRHQLLGTVRGFLRNAGADDLDLMDPD